MAPSPIEPCTVISWDALTLRDWVAFPAQPRTLSCHPPSLVSPYPPFLPSPSPSPQFYVADGELSCLMYQRSCDGGLGVPFKHRQLRAAHAHGGAGGGRGGGKGDTAPGAAVQG